MFSEGGPLGRWAGNMAGSGLLRGSLPLPCPWTLCMQGGVPEPARECPKRHSPGLEGLAERRVWVSAPQPPDCGTPTGDPPPRTSVSHREHGCSLCSPLKEHGVRWCVWNHYFPQRFPGSFPLRDGRPISPSPGRKLPSAPDTMLQALEEVPGQRPLPFLRNSECRNHATSVQLEPDPGRVRRRRVTPNQAPCAPLWVPAPGGMGPGPSNVIFSPFLEARTFSGCRFCTWQLPSVSVLPGC